MADKPNFDMGKWRIDPADFPAKTSLPKITTVQLGGRRVGRDFIMITRAQSDRLNKAKYFATERVFRHLLFQSFKVNGRTGNKPVRVANAVMASIGVDRYAKRRALRELEELGLIRVTRHRHRSPTVVIVVLEEGGVKDPGTR